MTLREEIRNKGFRFNWIAEKIGRKPPELTMWLRGNRNMPLEIEKQIRKLIS